MVKINRKKYQPHGAAAALFESLAREKKPRFILIEGPANTGKTLALCYYTFTLCSLFKGIRVLWIRDTKKSLAQSVQVTFEERVLPRHHHLRHEKVTRQGRESYRFRGTDAEIVLCGADNPTRTFSMEYDVIVVFEAHEITQDFWELLFRANRWKVLPWQQMICDTNPASEYHWLNQWFDEGEYRNLPRDVPKKLRLLSRHEDNPFITEDDLETLRSMTGARRARLYEGKWVSEEGQVWENFRRDLHIVDFQLDQEAARMLGAPPYPRDDQGRLKFAWTFISIDWGFTNPGCMGVWGVDADKRLYLVEEIYRTKMGKDWWADRFVELVNKWGCSAATADPEDAASIDLFNSRVARRPNGDLFVSKAKNSKTAGIDLVRDLLEPQKDGLPRILFRRETLLQGRDEELARQRKPLCTVQEVGSYVFPKHEDGKPDKEEPDKLCADHGCDQTRYAAMFVEDNDLTPERGGGKFAPGTYGADWDMDEILSGEAA